MLFATNFVEVTEFQGMLKTQDLMKSVLITLQKVSCSLNCDGNVTLLCTYFDWLSILYKYFVQYTLISTNTKGPMKFVRFIRNSY